MALWWPFRKESMDLVQITVHRHHEQLLLRRTNSVILVGRDFPARPHLWGALPTAQLYFLSPFLGITYSEHTVTDDEMRRWWWRTDHWAILFFSSNLLCKLSQRKSAIISYKYYCHQNTIQSEHKQVNKLTWKRFTVGLNQAFQKGPPYWSNFIKSWFLSHRHISVLQTGHLNVHGGEL